MFIVVTSETYKDGVATLTKGQNRLEFWVRYQLELYSLWSPPSKLRPGDISVEEKRNSVGP